MDYQVRMKIELPYQPWFSPGDLLVFKVHILTNRIVQIKKLDAHFRCVGKCTRFYHPHKTLVRENAEVTLAGADKALYPATGLVPSGTGLVLEPRGDETPSYQFHVFLRIPAYIPDSWDFYGTRYRAWVSSHLKVRGVVKLLDRQQGLLRRTRVVKMHESIVIVPIRNVAAMVDLSGEHKWASDWAEGYLGFPRSRGLVSCALRVRPELGMRGCPLPVELHLHNPSAHTLLPCLTLYKEYKFRDYDKWDRLVPAAQQRERVLEVLLPPLPPHRDWIRAIQGFTIPQDCQSSASLRDFIFVDLQFIVRLTVKSPTGSLRCEVRVEVGDKPSDVRQVVGGGLPSYTIPPLALASAADAAAAAAAVTATGYPRIPWRSRARSL